MVEARKKVYDLNGGYVKELKPYTKKELFDLFGLLPDEEDKLTKIIKLLRYNKRIKIHKKQNQSDNLSDMADEVIDVTDAIADVSGYDYVFTCVGVIVVGGVVLKCYPKYIDKDEDKKDLLDKFKQVLRVLEKYNSRNTVIRMFSENDGEKHFNFLEVSLFLLKDYYENGTYYEQRSIIEINGTGNVLWDRTVEQIQPILSNNRPYYTELLTKKRVDEQENYFKRLHEYVLTECSNRFKEHDLFELFEGVTPVELSDSDFGDFGDVEYILNRLEKELGQQFNSRKQQILNSLYAYIATKKSSYNFDCLDSYSTTDFELVWQDVCAAVMDNNLHTKLRDLEPQLLLHEKYKQSANKELIELIEKPLWESYSAENKLEASTKAKTLEPDIISVFEHEDSKYFAILDAKYYHVQYSPSFKGQPGIGDITKQYLYNLAYKDFIEKHNFDHVWNCFLMPVDGSAFVKRGYAKLEILQFFNYGNKNKDKHYKEKIDIILLPAETMYEWYLKNIKWRKDFYEFVHLVNAPEYGKVMEHNN